LLPHTITLLLLMLNELLISIGNFVKEAVAVDRELVDDLLYDRLDLHERGHATSDLAVKRLGAHSQELVDADFAYILVVQESRKQPDIIEGYVLVELLDSCHELRP
jgi:hypothetical protein